MIPIKDCRLIPSQPSPEDFEFIEQADLILVAGGQLELGLNKLRKNGLMKLLAKRLEEGALLVGVAEGGVLFGLKEWEVDSSGRKVRLTNDTIIRVKQESSDWEPLRKEVMECRSEMTQTGSKIKGIGIPKVEPSLDSVEPTGRWSFDFLFQRGGREQGHPSPDLDAAEARTQRIRSHCGAHFHQSCDTGLHFVDSSGLPACSRLRH